MAGIDYLSNAGAARAKASEVMRSQLLEAAGALLEVELDLDLVDPNPYQPRIDFGMVDEVAASILEHGQLYPVLVRASASGRYEVADGETRLRAMRANRERFPGDPRAPKTIRASVRVFADETMALVAFASGLRKDLNPLEEARGLERIYLEFGISYKVLGDRLGKTEAYVQDRMRLLTLPDDVQNALHGGTIRPGHAIVLGSFPDAVRPRLLSQVVDDDMSVKDLRALKKKSTPEVTPGVTSQTSKSSPLSTRYRGADAPEDENRDREWARLRALWKTLDPETRTRVLAYAEGLTKPKVAAFTRADGGRARPGRRRGFIEASQPEAD